MTACTRFIACLWTCFFASLQIAAADTPPPVLTNPSACGLGLFITEAGCGPANEFQVDVSNAPGMGLGSDVYLKELRLIIRHEWDADLDIHLKSPSGVVVEVSTDNGDTYDNYGNPSDSTCTQYTVFRAHAAPGACGLLSIKDGLAPFIGAFLPEGNFSDFNDGNTPNGLWTLMVCDDGAGNLGYLEYVELVFESTVCLPPTQVTVLEEDSTSVKLAWKTGSNCNNVVFEYGPVGFTPGTDGQPGLGGTVAIGNCPMHVLTGLSPNSTFEIYLRENCAPGVYSDNSCPVTVRTTCSPPPATIVENFNSQGLCAPACGVSCPIVGPWRNASNDNFDWVVNTDSTLTENTGPQADNPGGGNYIYLEASGTACTNNKLAVLVSNCFQVVVNADSCDMSFDYHFFGVHIGGMSFEISVNGGASWSVLWSASGNKGDKWRRKFIDLDAYNGQTVQFRFVGRGGNGKFADLALDNIAFYGSIDLGFPDYVYFRDADGDGYGDTTLFIATCQPNSFAGYVDNGDDCNDQDFFQNPGETEVLCDDFDSNCNGFDDEYFVEPVQTQNAVICSGGNGFVTASSVNFGEISWYDASVGGNLVGVGDTLYPNPGLLVNSGLDTLEIVFYAEEVTFTGCISNERTAASIMVLPSPKLATTDAPGNCAGILFDLNTININDENGLNGSLQFYDQLPFQSGNEVGPIVQPMTTTDYYIISEAVNGCRDTLTVTYTVQQGPVAHIPDSPTLCRNSVKEISVQNLGAGTPPFQVNWNSGQTTDTIAIFSDNNIGTVNTYAVTISDAVGCTSADTLSVTTIINISQIITSSSPVTTCNGSDGSINLTPLGGTAPYAYQWAGAPIPPQAGSLNLTGLEQGSYAFTVTDSSPEHCQVVVPVVVVNGPSASAEVDFVQQVSCSGGNDGCITLEITSGPNTTVNWSNGMTGPNVCGLEAGIYTATISESGCENVLTIPVTEPEALNVKAVVTNVSCFGGSNGAIELTIFGGTPPLSYHWSNDSNAAAIQNLPIGTYSVTVTDGKNCTTMLPSIQVHQPNQIALGSLSFQQPTCFGLNDGSISVGAIGGFPPYSYTWSNGGTGTSISNIAAGSYTVHVRDQNGCMFNQTVNLTQPPVISIATTNITPPSCAGQQSGSISIAVSGGNGNYDFNWSNGASTQNLSGIGNGNYAVTVTDGFGCTAVSNIGDVASPEALTAGIHQNPPLCIGRDENVLEAYVVSGGQPPYSYDWSTDDSGPILTNISYGYYVVTITDANGCESVHAAKIDSVQVLNLMYQAFPPLCYGQTGQLAMTITGGTEPYSVIWSNGQTGLVASNLLAQNHSATVTDANGCINSLDIISLSEPPELSLQLDDIENIACNGGDDGIIEITTSGGTLPYHFQWSNGAVSEDVAGLYAGSYGVTVSDKNGCTTALNSLQVTAPAQLNPVSSLGTPVSNCQSVQVDNVCVNVNGGVAPFQYLWETGDTTNCLLNPVPGDYHVTITDAAGCTIEFMSVKVPTEYTAIAVSQVPTGDEIVCFDAATGQLGVEIIGGSAPYQFNWSNGVHGITSSSNLFNPNLPVGVYGVTITDNSGCTGVSSGMQVTSFGAITPTIMGSSVEHVHCKGGSDGAIPLNVSGGLVPYSFSWENAAGDSISNMQHISGLQAGTYFVTVMDQLGCTATASTVLLEPTTTFMLNPPIIQNVACYGQNNGSIFSQPQAGDLPYQFIWNNMATSQGITGLPAGQYSVTVTDGNGCEKVGNYAVYAPDAPIEVMVLDAGDVTCFGDSDGFINIAVSGGTPSYTYSWNAFTTNQNLEDAPAGNYQLVIFDSMGCQFTESYMVGTPLPLQLTLFADSQTQVSPPNGTATADVSGGTPPYNFSWSNGMSEQTITDLTAGQYGVVVTDASGCTLNDWVFVDLVLGTIDNEVLMDCSFYPNPTSGPVNLSCAAASFGEDIRLRVFNAIGQMVLEETMDINSSLNHQFDLSAAPPGVYQVVADYPNGIVLRGKIMVQR